jgi:hypothetical protein
MVLPINMLSEYRNVGYSLPFMRYPVELYGSILLTNFDAGDVTYASHFGSLTHTLGAGIGVTSVRATIGERLREAYRGKEIAPLRDLSDPTETVGAYTGTEHQHPMVASPWAHDHAGLRSLRLPVPTVCSPLRGCATVG